MSEQLTGGCQCGAVRYAAVVDSRDGYYCHCRMCQRASGNVAAAFCNGPKSALSITHGQVAHYMSSPFGRRGFCRNCGTPLTFDYLEGANIDLTLGSLDDPARILLTSHFGVESRVPGWVPDDGLPATRCEDHAPLAARWAAAGGKPE